MFLSALVLVLVDPCFCFSSLLGMSAYRQNQPKSDTQRVEEMVERLKTIPDRQYINQLDDLIADCLIVGDQ